MKVCYFGTYNARASRNQILIRGLRENKVEVFECNSERPGIKKYFDLVKKHRLLRGAYDIMVVGYPSFKGVWLAKILTRKPIVFDAFISLYDSTVWDRQEISPKSFRALKYWITDWLSCSLADKVLLDTQEHINYFVNEFHLNQKKFHRIWIGADDKVFCPLPDVPKSAGFLVHFHGSFIPLQGIEYILEAAKKLEQYKDIHFRIVGNGQTYKKMRKYARDIGVNYVEWIDKVPYEEVNGYMARAHVVLGIFGRTPKAKRVIPHKLFEGLAAGAANISGDTPAARELLEDKKNIMFCNIADSDDLAAKILALRNNPRLRISIAANGRNFYLQNLTPVVIGRTLLNMVLLPLYEKGRSK